MIEGRCVGCRWWSEDGTIIEVPTPVVGNWHKVRNGLCETSSPKISTDCGENTIRTTFDFGCTEWASK